MKKKLTLLFTALAVFSMGLASCGSKTAKFDGPEWEVREDGHIYHYNPSISSYEDLGNVVGPKGDQGEQGLPGQNGRDGVDGKDGKDGIDGKDGVDGQPGANGQDGAPGAQGPQGEKGDAGRGIDHIGKSNDGEKDIYTIYYTDGTSEVFFTFANPAVSINAVVNPDVKYYAGVPADLDVEVTATFADGSSSVVDGFETTFSTDVPGVFNDVVVTFGAASTTVSVEVLSAFVLVPDFYGENSPVIPDYVFAGDDVSFEVDTSVEGYFDIYVNNSTAAEMDAYKDALVAEGWTVLGTSDDGDYRIGNGRAIVDLINFTDYILVSFWYDSDTAETVVAAANKNLSAYGIAITWDEEYQEYGLAVNFGSGTSTEENLKSAAHTLAGFLPASLGLVFESYEDPANSGYDVFGIGIATYYMAFETISGSVEATVIGYVYNDLLVAQLSIVDA